MAIKSFLSQRNNIGIWGVFGCAQTFNEGLAPPPDENADNIDPAQLAWGVETEPHRLAVVMLRAGVIVLHVFPLLRSRLARHCVF